MYLSIGEAFLFLVWLFTWMMAFLGLNHEQGLTLALVGVVFLNPCIWGGALLAWRLGRVMMRKLILLHAEEQMQQEHLALIGQWVPHDHCAAERELKKPVWEAVEALCLRRLYRTPLPTNYSHVIWELDRRLQEEREVLAQIRKARRLLSELAREWLQGQLDICRAAMAAVCSHQPCDSLPTQAIRTILACKAGQIQEFLAVLPTLRADSQEGSEQLRRFESLTQELGIWLTGITTPDGQLEN